MTATIAARTIGILNSTEDVIELLTSVLEDEGYATRAAYIPDFKRGRRDLAAWLDDLALTAILYDIPPVGCQLKLPASCLIRELYRVDLLPHR